MTKLSKRESEIHTDETRKEGTRKGKKERGVKELGVKELSKSDDGWELYHPFQVDHQNKGAYTNHGISLPPSVLRGPSRRYLCEEQNTPQKKLLPKTNRQKQRCR